MQITSRILVFRFSLILDFSVYLNYLKRFAQSAGPGSASFLTRFCQWNVFWSHFWYFVVILGALWLHFLHQGIDWSTKAALGGAKGGNTKINSPFWIFFSHMFDTFSRHAPLFSMSFRGDVLVMLSWCICVTFLNKKIHPFRVPCDLCPK